LTRSRFYKAHSVFVTWCHTWYKFD